jgi:alkylation response protein AidB-like acyl-CoA dehydrogenase
MPVYKAPLEDLNFVLFDLLKVEDLARYPAYQEATRDTVDSVLQEAARVAEEVLFPLNQSGDQEGCHFQAGAVTTPQGFKDAYNLFASSGWCGLVADPAYGGQGLPKVVGAAFDEMVCSANLSFGMYPGLSHGAYNALLLHGSDALKDAYLPKLASGEWSGTMCLTEPQCGTDLGLIRTRAVPLNPDQFSITGTKIFISAGEHDLTENILHLVLARLPDAPAGTKGISLFLVPKILPNGTPNAVACGAIEHKMGIKASSTCVMNFDGATGWLVGQPHQGMKAMFTMMNAARFAVGIQGLGIAEVAYQNALAYAKDRLQGRALTGAAFADKPADPILVHPDVRRNLLTMKALTEGGRALSCWIGQALDVEAHSPDPDARAEAADLVALMTPICKAFLTDVGFDCANLAVQIYGGHGYIREHGVEQFVRDARITQIYEGTNGIQALDLVGRKMGEGMGRLLRRFFHPVGQFLEAEKENPALAELLPFFAKSFAKLQQTSLLIASKGVAKPDEAGAAASDYLRMFALVALGYQWLRMATVAAQLLADGDSRETLLNAKLKTARFYVLKILPQVNALALAIQSGADPIMSLRAEEF